jgi:hypothetical protein
MDPDLLLLLRCNLSFFLDKLDVLEVFHFLIDYFNLEAKPDVAGDAEVVDAAAG